MCTLLKELISSKFCCEEMNGFLLIDWFRIILDHKTDELTLQWIYNDIVFIKLILGKWMLLIGMREDEVLNFSHLLLWQMILSIMLLFYTVLLVQCGVVDHRQVVVLLFSGQKFVQ